MAPETRLYAGSAEFPPFPLFPLMTALICCITFKGILGEDKYREMDGSSTGVELNQAVIGKVLRSRWLETEMNFVSRTEPVIFRDMQ